MAIDWQFLVVTAIALGAAFVIVRRFWPAPRGAAGSPGAPAGAACDHCETGAKAAAAAPADTRTQTTPVVSVRDLRASAKRQ